MTTQNILIDFNSLVPEFLEDCKEDDAELSKDALSKIEAILTSILEQTTTFELVTFNLLTADAIILELLNDRFKVLLQFDTCGEPILCLTQIIEQSTVDSSVVLGKIIKETFALLS